MGIKEIPGNVLRAVLGRKLLVRLSRNLLNNARLDFKNTMETNGELDIQRVALSMEDGTSPFTVFDIGANVGIWSKSMIAQCGPKGEMKLHCFEPVEGTCRTLRRELSKFDSHSIVIEEIALSDSVGEATVYSTGDGEGTNSLNRDTTLPASVRVSEEKVMTTTIDRYCDLQGIEYIRLIKIDAEGLDCRVIAGAHGMLVEGKVSIVQFEYNWRWVASRNFLKDIFQFTDGLEYTVGKLTRLGVELYDSWDPDLETFVEGNYVLIHNEHIPQIEVIKWWKE